MINYEVGDATICPANVPTLILQVCNNIGAYGAGFSGALSTRYPSVETNYREWYRRSNDGSAERGIYVGSTSVLKVGVCQFVAVGKGIFVANMVAQHGIATPSNPRPISYSGLAACLKEAADYAHNMGLSRVQMPLIGCCRAGGSWAQVRPLIEQAFSRYPDIELFIVTQQPFTPVDAPAAPFVPLFVTPLPPDVRGTR